MENAIWDLLFLGVLTLTAIFAYIRFILLATRKKFRLPSVYLGIGIINGFIFLIYGSYAQLRDGFVVELFLNSVLLSLAVCIGTFVTFIIFWPIILRFYNMNQHR